MYIYLKRIDKKKLYKFVKMFFSGLSRREHKSRSNECRNYEEVFHVLLTHYKADSIWFYWI